MYFTEHAQLLQEPAIFLKNENGDNRSNFGHGDNRLTYDIS